MGNFCDSMSWWQIDCKLIADVYVVMWEWLIDYVDQLPRFDLVCGDDWFNMMTNGLDMWDSWLTV